MRWVKFIFMFALVALMVSLGPSLVRAQGPVTGNPPDQSPLMRNGVDPNYVPTAEELKAIAAKQAQAKQHWEQTHASKQVQPMTTGFHKVTVGVYQEPNDHDHRNYCGPAATQVILSARTSQVPGIEQIATDEHLNPDVGVFNTDVRYELNRLLNTSWYWYVTSSSAATVWYDIVFDIDHGWALDTSLWTTNMYGWNGRVARHIVAIWGYWEGSPSYAYYTETGRSAQGYYSNYWMGAEFGLFYGYISQYGNNNNSQVW